MRLYVDASGAKFTIDQIRGMHNWSVEDGADLTDFGYTSEDTPDPAPILSCNAAQIRMALTRLNLRASVENAVTASVDQNLKDLWQYSPHFSENDPRIMAMASSVGVDADGLHSLFQLAVTL
jgi:hypothetical protein